LLSVGAQEEPTMSRIDTVTIAPTTTPKAAPGRFEAALQGAARSLARSVVGAVAYAAPAVPFGTVLVGAVRGGAVASAAAPALPSGSVAGASLGEAATGGVAGAVAAGTQGDLLEATRALQQEAQAMNLQYLQLQEQMQRESREYQALSNVMKVKHDAARAAIANIH
jgi:acetyl-CoA carboxylase carboxyltransferase component